MIIKNFFIRLFEDNTFDNLPNAVVDHNGILISSNKEFKKYITAHLGIKLKDILHVKTVDNRIIASKDGYEWIIIYKEYYDNQYRVWTIPQIQDSPSIWSIIDTPMVIIDTKFEIKYVNRMASEKPFSIRQNDYMSKYCPAFHKGMLEHDSAHDILWSESLCRVRVFQKNPTLWLIVIDKSSDLDRVDTELQKTNHLKSIGQITSSVVHDFRNILAVIDGYCQLIMDETKLSTIHGYSKQIHSTTQNAVAMVKELLRFTRSNLGEVACTSPAEMLDNLKLVIQKVVGSSIHVTIDIKETLARVGLAPADLERIILNIIMNAKDAMNSVGNLNIKLFKKYIPEALRINDCYLRSGFYVAISFDDTGCGIPAELQAKIFTPFFTTKKTGNGLGLSTILSILRDISGGLSLISTPGKGTKIIIYMPIVQHSPQETVAEESCEVKLKPISRKTIVVVEDNLDVLEICRVVLNKDNHCVYSYSNAEDALRLFQSKINVDLLITDANLPNMTGSELVQAISDMNKLSKVLVISGYDKSILKDKFPVNTEFLTKPIPLSELQQKVHNILIDEVI